MTVFKGYILLFKRNLNMMFLYMVIFLGITVIVQLSREDGQKGNYEAVKLDIAVVDRDGGTLAKGLTKMLEEKHHLVEVEDSKKVLQEELFYGNINYIVTIPEHFEKECLEAGKEVTVTRRPGEYASAYVDQQISQFMNQIKSYKNGGYDTTSAVEKTLHVGEKQTDIIVLDKNGNGGQMPDYAWMLLYFPYLYIAVLSFCMGGLIIIFKNKNIRRRINCSPVSLNKQNLQAILAYAIVSIAFWAITMFLPITMYRGAFLSDVNLGYYMLNSFLLLLVCIGIAMVVGSVCRNETIISAMVNVISLGMCFTCGVFVPMSMLGAGVKTAAQFLPVYWYVKNNALLGEFATVTGEMKGELIKGFGIQLAFAIALVCVALVITKSKAQKTA